MLIILISNYFIFEIGKLDLSHNRIQSLNSTVLKGLSDLKVLDLNSNRLENIDSGTFNDTFRLRQLKLGKNRISSIPKDLFKNLKLLLNLDLSGNRLTTIDSLTFSGLESLKVLKLKRNDLVELLDAAFWPLSNLASLHLSFNNLKQIKKGWLYGLSNLRHLYLMKNSLNSIEDASLDSCSKLIELDLSYNHLEVITKQSFQKLSNLKSLLLGNNNISLIEDESFKNLNLLVNLELNNNQMSWVIEDSNQPFFDLEKLHYLNLSFNHIKLIPKNVFKGLHNLNVLDLNHNPITTIMENAFDSLSSLQNLKINSSSLVCDCQLIWFYKWSKNHEEFSNFFESIKCQYPSYLASKGIKDIDETDLVCQDFPRPMIIEEPQAKTALRGANTSLSCRASSSFSSLDSSADSFEIFFKWRKNDRLLKDVEIFAQSLNDSITEYTSLLHLINTQDADVGDYQCIAFNLYGIVYSQKAKVTINVMPTFTKTPVDITVKKGNTARLECAAKGKPLPEISWEKDGGDDFPAARERRMHVMSLDDVFFFVDVKANDSGIYSCKAMNDAGVIVANASLTVLEPPNFLKPMSDKEVRVGESAVLECMASGNPKPFLNWTKDGDILTATERLVFTPDNQLLIILEAQVSDSGIYSCEMSNSVGSVKEFSNLLIVPDLKKENISVDSDLYDLNSWLSNQTFWIIISIFGCGVITSFIWVLVLYWTRKTNEDYTPTHTDDSTLPDEEDSFNAILNSNTLGGSQI